MARQTLSLEIEAFDKLTEAMKAYGDNAIDVINQTLWNEGGQMITDAIMQLLPQSGRSWVGKKPAAKSSAPFTQVNENLSVTVKTKSAYNYLYFPDDGSTTRKHAGNQQFMLGGATNQQDAIIELCIGKLTQIIE